MLLTRLVNIFLLTLFSSVLLGQGGQAVISPVSGDQDKHSYLKTVLERSEELIQMGNYGEALHDALFVYAETDSTPFYKERGSALNKISAIHYHLGDKDKSLNTLLELIQLCRSVPELNPRERGVLVNVGLLYQEKKDSVKALDYYNQAMYYQGDSSYWPGSGSIHSNLGELYMERGDLQKADQALRQAIEVFVEEKDLLREASVWLLRAQLATTQGKVKEAQSYLKTAEEKATGLENHEFELDHALTQAIVGYDSGNFKEAYRNLLKHYQLKDSIYYSDREQLALRWQSMYEGEKKDREIQELRTINTEDQLLLSQSRTEKAVIGGIAATLLLLAGFLFFRFHTKRKNEAQLRELNQELQRRQEEISRQNEAIRQINAGLENEVHRRTQTLRNVNKELDTFLYQSSHALRRPLMQIAGLLNLEEANLNDADREMVYGKIRISIENMDAVLRKLAQVSQIMEREPQVLGIDFPLFLQETWQGVAEQCSFPSPKLQLGDLPAKIEQDPYLLDIILYSILENACFFSQNASDPKVEISAESNEQDVRVSIRDNGPGLPEGQEQNIFKMFWVGHVDGPGQGLGLFVAKKALEKISGSIEVQNSGGALITIFLPKE